MYFISALYFSFITSALAYRVIVPSATKGWTSSGPQPLVWERVDTDPLNFTVVITNPDSSLLPADSQLSALINGTALQATLNPPSAGWPIGGSFQINLVRDTNNLNAILAQSTPFEIKEPNITITSTYPVITKPLGVTPTGVKPPSATNTASDNDPLAPNAAVSTVNISSGLISIFVMLGLFLA